FFWCGALSSFPVGLRDAETQSRFALQHTRHGYWTIGRRDRMDKLADPRYTQAVQAYEQALKSMQSQKFDRAKTFFEKVIASGQKELVDRAMVHLNICNQQLTRVQTNFKSVDEHYDYAISLLNMGDYVGARE